MVWILLSLVIGLGWLIIYSICYAGGKADDIMERIAKYLKDNPKER